MALKRKDELYMTDESGNAVKPSTVDKTAPTGPVSPSVTSKEETKPSAPTGTISPSVTNKREDIFMVDANGNKYDPLTNKPVSSQPSTPSTTTPTTPTTTSPSTKIQGLTNKAPSLPGYTAPTYQPSEAVNQAAQMLADQMAKAPGQYNSPWSTQLNDTLNKILNREKFSYDLNGDAFYQQYKDKFTQQARMASEDAVARASAMTGGYGNSYAATAGAQAFNEQMGQLNDVIPELYQMAYDKYAREGQDLKDAYSMLAAREAEAYGKYRDEKADYLTERDYLTGRLESEQANDYNRFANDRNFGYGANRDTVADNKWQSEFDLAVDQYNKNLELSQREATLKEQVATDEANAAHDKFLNDTSKEIATKFKDTQDAAEYIADLLNNEEITNEEADALLDKYDFANREWSKGDENLDPVFNIPTGATIVTDQYGNEMTLKELQDKLMSEGMSDIAFQAWYEKMLKTWGYEPL